MSFKDSQPVRFCRRDFLLSLGAAGLGMLTAENRIQAAEVPVVECKRPEMTPTFSLPDKSLQLLKKISGEEFNSNSDSLMWQSISALSQTNLKNNGVELTYVGNRRVCPPPINILLSGVPIHYEADKMYIYKQDDQIPLVEFLISRLGNGKVIAHKMDVNLMQDGSVGKVAEGNLLTNAQLVEASSKALVSPPQWILRGIRYGNQQFDTGINAWEENKDYIKKYSMDRSGKLTITVDYKF